jgi:hypothetical protein
VAYLGHVI